MLSTKNAASIVDAAFSNKKGQMMIKLKFIQGTRIAGEHYEAGKVCIVEDKDFADYLINTGKAEIQKEEKKRGRPPKVESSND